MYRAAHRGAHTRAHSHIHARTHARTLYMYTYMPCGSSSARCPITEACMYTLRTRAVPPAAHVLVHAHLYIYMHRSAARSGATCARSRRCLGRAASTICRRSRAGLCMCMYVYIYRAASIRCRTYIYMCTFIYAQQPQHDLYPSHRAAHSAGMVTP